MREKREFGEYDLLVLHHGQTALAFELSRRHAVSAAELRLAGDLLDDLEHERLDEREAARRMAAFGLEPGGSYAASWSDSRNGLTGERLRLTSPASSTGRAVRYLSTARLEKAAFLVEAGERGGRASHSLGEIVEVEPDSRVGVGRPAQGRASRAAACSRRAPRSTRPTHPVASYRDLGSLELLLNLPDAALEAFVDRVLGASADERLAHRTP